MVKVTATKSARSGALSKKRRASASYNKGKAKRTAAQATAKANANKPRRKAGRGSTPIRTGPYRDRFGMPRF